MNARNRLADLEQRANDGGACAACRSGTAAVVSEHHEGEPCPPTPEPCPMCGRERLHIVLAYTDALAGGRSQ